MAHVWLKRPGKNDASVTAGCRWTSLNICHFCMLTKYMFKSHLENFWVLWMVVKIYLLAGTLILFQAHISALANAGISTYFNQSDFWLRNYFILGASFCLLLFDLHGNLFFSCHSQWIFGVAGCVSFSSHPMLSIPKALLGRDGIEGLHFWNSDSTVKGVSSIKKFLETPSVWTEENQPKWTGPTHWDTYQHNP